VYAGTGASVVGWVLGTVDCSVGVTGATVVLGGL